MRKSASSRASVLKAVRMTTSETIERRLQKDIKAVDRLYESAAQYSYYLSLSSGAKHMTDQLSAVRDTLKDIRARAKYL